MGLQPTEIPDRVIDELIARRLAGDPSDLASFGSDLGVPANEVGMLLSRLERIEQARRRVEQERLGGGDESLESADLARIAPGYITLKEIARGGQAVVYLARRESDGRLVALKVLRDRISPADSRRQQRFTDELKILQSLDHPQIVTLVDSGSTIDGDRFLATRFIDGPMLDPKALAETKPVEWRLQVMISLCRAMQVAHEKGVVHRDLKPSNIRFDEAGRPVVLDFGLARQINDDTLRRSLTTTGEFLGTFLWASPEQAAGQAEVSPASDVYALGVILHQLFCAGRFPPQVHETVRAAIEPDSPSASVRIAADQLDAAGLEPILYKCLAPRAIDRFGNAGELADALERLANVWNNTPSGRSAGRGSPPAPAVAGLVILLFVLGFRLVAWPAVRSLGFTNEAKSVSRLVNGRPMENVLGIPFVWVPPGEFEMGGTSDEPSPLADARIVRKVKVANGFYLGKVEVTQAVFERVMGSNPSRFVDTAKPVERVSWHAAKEFCRRASEMSGKRVRLPTEIEWEYAARAGTRTMFFWGSDARFALRYANFADRSAVRSGNQLDAYMDYDDHYPGTAPCGSFLDNPWRIQDLLGNVWEWCDGTYQADPTDPATAVAERVPVRGGSWWDPASIGSCSNRNALHPDQTHSTVGFRVAMDE